MVSEIEMLSSFKHCGIIRLLHADKQFSNCFFTMELATGGDLLGRFQTNKADEKLARHIVKQIVSAVFYLHHNSAIVHNDITPGNVLLMTRDILPVVKLTDFGVSRAISEIRNKPSYRGTKRFVAPEMLEMKLYPDVKKKPLNEKIDVYAIGLTLLYVSSNVRFVSRGVNDYKQLLKEIKDGKFTEEIIPKLQKEKKSENFVSFFNSCVAVDEKDRANAIELVCHPWLCFAEVTEQFNNRYFRGLLSFRL